MTNQPQEGGDEANKRNNKSMDKEHAKSEASSNPCGACKYIRRKCRTQFTIVHKVFGTNNVSKMLNVALDYHHEMVVSLLYEARARLIDLVYGCFSTMFLFNSIYALFTTHRLFSILIFLLWKKLKRNYLDSFIIIVKR
ncbi:LOB domain-containing protein 20, partial [Mucuna pruriens]